MTEQEKQLLIKDLCARLSYGVKATTTSNGWNGTYDITGYVDGRIYLDCPIYDEGDDEWMVESVKPYLRPMSSMTEEEKEELKELIDSEDVDEKGVYFLEGGTLEDYLSQFSYKLCNIINDWLNSHHFDYRGLIEKGLASEAPEDMYKF